jgi:hypothetical protein
MRWRSKGKGISTMAHVQNAPAMTSDRGLEETLNKTGWGVALIWIGAAMIFNIGWGAGLFGLGVITLVGQPLRRFLSLAWDWFAVVLGICLCLAGIGPVLGINLSGAPLLPLLSIALGAMFVASALFRRRSA